jgi:hypothetical protein
VQSLFSGGLSLAEKKLSFSVTSADSAREKLLISRPLRSSAQRTQRKIYVEKLSERNRGYKSSFALAGSLARAKSFLSL